MNCSFRYHGTDLFIIELNTFSRHRFDEREVWENYRNGDINEIYRKYALGGIRCIIYVFISVSIQKFLYLVKKDLI